MAFLGASFLGARVGGSGACGPAAALASSFVRSPLVTRWRNKGVAPKWDKSNKGKQNWYKGRGVGLHGALNKQGTQFRENIYFFFLRVLCGAFVARPVVECWGSQLAGWLVNVHVRPCVARF